MYTDQWVFVSKFNIPEKKVQEPIYHYDKNHVLIKFKVKVQLRDKQASYLERNKTSSVTIEVH